MVFQRYERGHSWRDDLPALHITKDGRARFSFAAMRKYNLERDMRVGLYYDVECQTIGIKVVDDGLTTLKLFGFGTRSPQVGVSIVGLFKRFGIPQDTIGMFSVEEGEDEMFVIDLTKPLFAAAGNED